MLRKTGFFKRMTGMKLSKDVVLDKLNIMSKVVDRRMRELGWRDD